MNEPHDILQRAIADARASLEKVGGLQQQIAHAADLISDCLAGGGKLLVCGNGGSAADGADFATEFACRFAEDRRPYPAINLATGASLLTATANDYGFDEVFARQIRAFAGAGDVLIAISTSGRSQNICRALAEAKSLGVATIALLGRDGSDCRGLANVEMIAPGNSTARIQEMHKFLLHVLCEIAETRLPRS